MKNKLIILILSGLFFSTTAKADQENKISLSVGAGVITRNGIYQSEDKYKTFPVAAVNLKYDNFYINYDEIGYDFYSEDGMKLGVIGKVHLGYDSEDLKDEYDSMEDRDFDFHLGLKTTYNYDIYKFVTFATGDVSGESDGKSLGFEGSARYTMIDGKLYFIPAAGVTYVDGDFVDYFYGVKGSEAVAGGINDGLEYRGAGDVIYGLKGTFNYIYNKDLSFQWINGVKLYGGNINNSPIVRKDYSVYTGLVISYRFL
ncbi:MipA/OmpV family protein [uncultured Ilyobacter sp.]|uniref:MipA/OmpV family protein n=1 Tax=uncultured Ilyobacter sp. TaxID=544433 RepID=UPI0029C8B42F|nr:MipA/OmpV family protein [uncultured Ilyobacter sp.]